MICLICNIEFDNTIHLQKHLRYMHEISSINYYNKYIKKENNGLCEVCGKCTKYLNLTKGYRDFCSIKCMRASDRISKKRICTNIKKFGVDNPSKNEVIKKKKIETTIKNYGVEHHLQSNEIKDSIRLKNIEKYGVDWVSQREDIKEKIKETNKNRYGVEYSFHKEEVKNKQRDNYINNVKYKLNILNLKLLDSKYYGAKKDINVKCKMCNLSFTTKYFNVDQSTKRNMHYSKCPNCFPRLHGDSIAEKEVKEFLKNLKFKIVENDKQLIKPLELDIYIPEKKIAIEYNGLYWHSEEQGKDKFYHLNKLKMCLEKNINLIQIFEDEWLFKRDIAKNRLKQILNVSNSIRIHARKCIIKEIDPKLKNEFLEKYHLQGKDNSKIKLGAFHNEELVAVMTFSKGNIAKGSCSKEGVWELNRFCSNYEYHIPGVASKLLAYFKRFYEYKQIFSYADRRWSQGNVYYKIGFELEKITKPNYWYVHNKDTYNRINRYTLRKKPNEPKDISENILRINEGYFRIWDCGNIKFSLTK